MIVINEFGLSESHLIPSLPQTTFCFKRMVVPFNWTDNSWFDSWIRSASNCFKAYVYFPFRDGKAYSLPWTSIWCMNLWVQINWIQGKFDIKFKTLINSIFCHSTQLLKFIIEIRTSHIDHAICNFMSHMFNHMQFKF